MASQLGDKAKWPYSSASSGTSTMPEHVVAAPPTSSIPTHEFTPEIAVETLETEEEEEEQPTGPTWIRWVILGFACSIVFGNYYAFDNPAALNTPLQEYMQLSDYDYAYFLNILYAAYSIPNIVAPWFGGYAIDRFGNRKLLIILSIMVSFGHMIVCLGLERRSITAMIAGRVIFGAAESLSVTQSAITVKYFRGKELSMALGINLSVSRLGSVLNDIATPYIWKRSSVQVAFWFGLLSCVMSTLIAFALAALDWRYGRHLDLIRMDPHLLLANSQGLEKIDRLPSPSRDLDSVLDEEHVGREDKGAQGALPDEKRRITEGEERDYQGTPNPCRPPLPRVSNHGSGVNNNDRDHALSNTLVPHTFQSRIIGWIRSLVGFSLSFWILYAIGFLIVGVSVPFNSIHAGFLQMRWYHDDPLKAAQIMTVPDLIAALIVLPAGWFVDHFGQRTWIFLICSLILGVSHLVLGVATIPSPVPCLLALGFSSAIVGIICGVVPLVVNPRQLGTAFGILTSAYNLAFVVFPLIVARLMTIDPSVYTSVEIFFSTCGFLGVVLTVWMKLLDKKGILDQREIKRKSNTPHSDRALGDTTTGDTH